MPHAAVSVPRKPVLQPATALLILGVDWLFFGADAMTLGASVLLTSIAAFTITAIGVFFVQRKKGGDSLSAASIKAILAGAVAGVPTSIGGTVVGTLVLTLAGVRRAIRS